MTGRFELARFRALRNSADTANQVSAKARSLATFMAQLVGETPHANLGVQVVPAPAGSEFVAEFKSPFGNAQLVLFWEVLRAGGARVSDMVAGRLVALCPDPCGSAGTAIPVWQMYVPKDGEPWIPNDGADLLIHIDDPFGHNLNNDVFLATMDLLLAVLERKPIQI